MKYLSARHRRLMQQSELALEEAASSQQDDTARVATQVLGDAKILSLWETQHANLLLPVAENDNRRAQILELRKLETRLMHRSSLIKFIRTHRLVGRQRDKLFSVFYGPRDKIDAILIEHRNYLLSESSHVSSDHLISLLHDTDSQNLLRMYMKAYETFFSLYCYMMCCDDNDMAKAVSVAMQDARQRVSRFRERLLSQKPSSRGTNLDREVLIAETGRHKAVNYLNR